MELRSAVGREVVGRRGSGRSLRGAWMDASSEGWQQRMSLCNEVQSRWRVSLSREQLVVQMVD